MLLGHGGIAGLGLDICGWLVLLLLQGLVLRRHSLWLAHWRLAVGGWLDGAHERVGWAGLNDWSLSDSLGRDELLASWDGTELLLGVVGDVLLVLSALLSELLVDFLSELVHELADPSLHLLVDQVGNPLAHVVRDLLQLVVVVLGPRHLDLLVLNRGHLLLWTSFYTWSLCYSSILRFVSRFDWWGSSFILNIFPIVRHLVVNQNVLSNEWLVVIDQVISIIVLLIVTH